MKTIGDYSYDENIDNLGEGNFGTVFKGHHVENSEKLAAIKILNLKKTVFKSMPPDCIDREIAILQDVAAHPHPNLVHMLHCERTPDNIHLVMEFCNGGDLGDYLKAKRRLDESTILLFFKQIASGLKILHDRNILHRDMKPENVLLCFTGDRYPAAKEITLKIADFGVGKFLPADATTETFCGTYFYMAPEIRARKRYTKQVDLWSVGAMMFQCLTGNLNGAPDFVQLQSVLPAGTSPSLSSLLQNLLVHDPQQRLNGDKFLNHVFFGETISVTVIATGNDDTKLIKVNHNEDVDHLINLVSINYNMDSEVVLLFHDGTSLERGSGSSIRESGIKNNGSITLAMRLPGGIDIDGKVAANSSSSVFSLNSKLQLQA